MPINETACITVPATTANLGPAFDCLGMALALRNRFRFTRSDKLTICVQGEGADELPCTAQNLVVKAAQKLCDHLGRALPAMHIEISNHIPVGSGLGSSSTAIVGGLAGVNRLLGDPANLKTLLALATEMEGHADNVAPALLGGLVAARSQSGRVEVLSLPVADWQVVVVLPDFALSTYAARAALPATVPLAHAVANVGNMPFLLKALAEGDFGGLAQALADHLHQPYRVPLIPGLAAVMESLGRDRIPNALSGAGPSLIAFPPADYEAVADRIQAIFAAGGLKSRAYHLRVDPQGILFPNP